MRELTESEQSLVNGGFNPIPLISAAYLGFEIGWATGTMANDVARGLYGSTLGESIYYLSN
jgi:hypothetical protein